jgi:2,3-dihydroxybiphenyl 1,2-dioxygenase
MSVSALGYVVVRTNDLSDWSSFGPGLLGLQRIDRSRTSLAFRMDDRKQRIVVDAAANGDEGISVFGWEVNDAAALEALAARLEFNGVKVMRGAHALADERFVRDLIVFSDPLGNRLEAFHGAETASDPFAPGRSISGFRTGPLGLGHIVLGVETSETIQQLLPFYRDVLGFRLTDYYSHPFEAYFLHVNRRHHSLAMIRTGKNAVHHIMMEVLALDDMGRGYDIAHREGCVSTTMGQHTSDAITSFYTYTPSGFMVEYGWGARSIESETWQAYERNEGPSMWGHDRVSLPREHLEAALRFSRDNAEKAPGRSVQVIDDSFNRMSGVCSWWDGMKGRGPRT